MEKYLELHFLLCIHIAEIKLILSIDFLRNIFFSIPAISFNIEGEILVLVSTELASGG